jgi:nucleotide-binding universal stress UspA family protein
VNGCTPRRLLVGFDGSRPAHVALSWAEGAVQRNHGRLIVVLVVSPPWFAIGWPAMAIVPTAHELEQGAIDVLRAAIDGLAEDLSVSWHVVHGSVGTALERAAFRHDCDAIAIGRGNRRWRPWPGATERYLRSHVSVPVIAVPAATADAHGPAWPAPREQSALFPSTAGIRPSSAPVIDPPWTRR